MLTEDGVERLEHRVPGAAVRLVLFGLLFERGQVERVPEFATARELHEGGEHHVRILGAEQGCPIARELTLPVPLEDRHLERQERDAGKEGQVADADEHDDLRDRAVGDMAAHDVAELVRPDLPRCVT